MGNAEYMWSPSKNPIMVFGVLTSLAVFATAVSGLDLGCGDFSYNICHDPPAAQELHVGTLEECIQNCDIFATFDSCDYIIYFEKGPDENCKIISGTGTPEEEMAIYMAACSVTGQPMTTTGENDGENGGQCVAGPLAECASTCKNPPCVDCSKDDCRGYKGSECNQNGPPGETIDQSASYEACQTICTLQMGSNPWTYLTYDKEQAECICYEDSTFTCTHQVVIQGMTIDEVNKCH